MLDTDRVLPFLVKLTTAAPGSQPIFGVSGKRGVLRSLYLICDRDAPGVKGQFLFSANKPIVVTVYATKGLQVLYSPHSDPLPGYAKPSYFYHSVLAGWGDWGTLNAWAYGTYSIEA